MRMPRLFPVVALLLPTLASGPTALAQWSADPAVNTPIATRPDVQEQSKLSPDGSGGWYVSWYDNDPNGGTPFGYDVYLQRLDASGRLLWPLPGLLVADRGVSWTTDYDLVADRDGNAVLAFVDDRWGTWTITVAKVSPSGDMLWGPDGVQVGEPDVEKGTPMLALVDGDVVVAYWDSRGVGVTRLCADGGHAWTQHIASPAYRMYLVADVVAADAGSVIVSFTFNGFQTSAGSIIHLLANKFAADGRRLWGDVGIAVYKAGYLAEAQFPRMTPDGRGGMLVAFRTIWPLAELYVQHVTGEGQLRWGPKAAAVAEMPSYLRRDPALTYDPATRETIVVYVDERNGQAVHAQKLDARGARLWGPDGVELRTWTENGIGSIRSVRHGDEVGVYWGESTPEWPPRNTVYGARLDIAGQLLCAMFPVATFDPFRSLVVASAPDGMDVLSWTDARADEGDVYAQNVTPHCTLGPPVPAD